MKFAVVNLGCKVNRVEADALSLYLLERGAQEVIPETADYVVVNTCTVTGEAEKKTRKAVRSVLRTNTSAQVIVTGCASAINPEEFLQLDSRVAVVDKFRLNDYFDSKLLSLGNASTNDLSLLNKRTRVGVKIQDGCNHACTYCIVHVARGRSYSVPADQVINECVAKAKAGAPEIVLTGINLGSYKDNLRADNPIDLNSLVEMILRATAKYPLAHGQPCRLRISSVEPMDVNDGLIDCMVRNQGRVCWHLHLPLQSGSSKVLKDMNL